MIDLQVESVIRSPKRKNGEIIAVRNGVQLTDVNGSKFISNGRRDDQKKDHKLLEGHGEPTVSLANLLCKLVALLTQMADFVRDICPRWRLYIGEKRCLIDRILGKESLHDQPLLLINESKVKRRAWKLAKENRAVRSIAR